MCDILYFLISRVTIYIYLLLPTVKKILAAGQSGKSADTLKNVGTYDRYVSG